MNFLRVTIEEQAGAIFAVEESFRLRLNTRQAGFLKKYVGKEIDMGVRAEDLHYDPKAADDISIKTRVEVIETLGSHTEVYVQTKLHQMIARVEANVDFSVGDECRLVPYLEKLAFFDGETEETLGLD